jgi:hypothetical protein
MRRRAGLYWPPDGSFTQVVRGSWAKKPHELLVSVLFEPQFLASIQFVYEGSYIAVA